MLQWTCRLRDLLEANGSWTDCDEELVRASGVKAMREAEFVGQNGKMENPEHFDWESLVACYNGE
jgi:hypothetical protein